MWVTSNILFCTNKAIRRFNLFLDPNTTAIVYVLTFHLLYRHLLYCHLLYRHLLYHRLLYLHLLYRHLLYRHWIIPTYINTALTRPTVSFGSASIGRVHSCVVPNQNNGTILLQDIADSVRHDDPHYAATKLVSLENTHNMCGGVPLPVDYIDDVGELAKEKNIALHIDGARICNASAAQGVPLERICRHVDSISVCLSKGLGSPVGSLLVGETEFITRARRYRKALGGGMRQAGILAACGLISLNVMSHRLIVDHARLNMMTEGLLENCSPHVTAANRGGNEDGTDVMTTNLGFYTIVDGRAGELVDALRERHGILMSAKDDNTIRACTHYHIGDDEIQRVVDGVKDVVKDW